MTATFLIKCFKKMTDVHRGKSRKHFKRNLSHVVCPVHGPKANTLPEGFSTQEGYLPEEDKLWIVGEFSPIEVVKIWLFHNTDKILCFKKSMFSDNPSVSF